MGTELERRGFLMQCLALAAAPAIVRVGSLMPVVSRRIIVPSWVWVPGLGGFNTVAEAQAAIDANSPRIPYTIVLIPVHTRINNERVYG